MKTFGNGNKGRSGPNAGKGRTGGNRFSGGRKPSPAGDGTGFRSRAGSGKSEGDASHPRSYSGGSSSRGEDRPFNRSYGKPFEKGLKPYTKSENSGESRSDSSDRPYRSRDERPTGDRPYKRSERTSGDSSDRPYRGRSERPSLESGDRPYKRSERTSGDSSDRPYRGRSERPSLESGDRPFKRSERPSGDSFDRPFRSRDENTEGGASERPFGRAEKPSREPKERPYRGRTDRPAPDSGDKPFKRSDKSFRDQDNKPRRNRIEKEGDGTSDNSFKAERPYREPFARPTHKPSTERDGKSKPSDRPAREYTDRPKRNSGSEKIVPFDDTKEMRINKYISNCGYCSRREADTLIAAGAVKVNGEVVSELGSKVLPTDKVQIGDVTLNREVSRYILLNKPKGYITTSDDPFDRKTVMSLVTNACRERIYPVGRLDRNTSGLLLFTNDGDLAKKLTHPKYGVRKVYHVGLDKALTKNDMLTIADGITLEDGAVKVDEIAYVNDDKKEIGIELHSGQNRVVRRIFETLGYDVEKLDRVVFANLTKKDLARGRWRLLEQHEINTLKMSL
jgi:23S rRNA pseudouridine2605 synthase